MVIYKCDICRKDTDRKDLHIIRIEKEIEKGSDYTFAPVIAPKEICIFCQEVIVDFLNKMEKERFNESQT